VRGTPQDPDGSGCLSHDRHGWRRLAADRWLQSWIPAMEEEVVRRGAIGCGALGPNDIGPDV